MQKLKLYMTVRPTIESMLNNFEAFSNDTNEAIQRLRPATNGWQWFFSSSYKKTQADLSYLSLKDIVNEDCAKHIKQASKLIIGATDNSPDLAAFHDFEKRPLAYYQSLCQILSNHIEWPDIPLIINSIAKVTDLLDLNRRLLSSTQNRLENDKNTIQLFIQKAKAAAAIETVKNIPIEELLQIKPGLRVKTFREAGYESIYDIHCATISSLGSIYGISYEMANQIKQAAKLYIEDSLGGIKLHLSTDHKTQELTILIVSVFQYKQHISLQEKLIALQPLLSANEISTRNLQQVQNVINWIFTTEEKRKSAIQEYQTLETFAEQDCILQLREIQRLISSPKVPTPDTAWADFCNDPISYSVLLEQVDPDVFGSSDKFYGLPEDLAREIQDEAFFPDGLLCTPYRYQEWGIKYILHQNKVLLGDEMGLGKTVQAIGTMVSLRNTGATHFFVICPASVLMNWKKEIEKKSKLRAFLIYGDNRELQLADWIHNGGVAVTTYETTGKIKFAVNFHYELLVVDEAHYIKNKKAQRTVNVLKISTRANRLLFMTGTALENKVDEMITLISYLQPQLANVLSVSGSLAPKKFQQTIAPVYYRRKLEQVHNDIPELIDTEAWCNLSPAEETLYESSVLRKQFMECRRVSWQIPNPSQSSKAQRLLEIVEDAKDDNRLVIVFSFFLDTIRKIKQLLGNQCLGPIDGSVSPEERQRIIEEFESKPAGTVLLAQIQAGGTGLNIQSASVIILCEPQLKPSIENQAIARAHRMGQKRNVLVYRLLCVNTIDERIRTLLKEKQSIFNNYADPSAAAEATEKEEAKIDDKTYGKLINEEIERIKKEKGIVDDFLQTTDSSVSSNINSQSSTSPQPSIGPLTTPMQAPNLYAPSKENRTEKKESAHVCSPSSDHTRNTTVGYLNQSQVYDTSASQNSNTEATNKATNHASITSIPVQATVPHSNIITQKSPAIPVQTISQHEEVTKTTSSNSSLEFDSIESFIQLLRESNLSFIDNRDTSGYLWISSNPFVDQTLGKARIQNKLLNHLDASPALGGKPGWYILCGNANNDKPEKPIHYHQLVGKRVFHSAEHAPALVLSCDGKYITLRFESGRKANSTVEYSLEKCLDNHLLTIID